MSVAQFSVRSTVLYNKAADDQRSRLLRTVEYFIDFQQTLRLSWNFVLGIGPHFRHFSLLYLLSNRATGRYRQTR